VPEAAYQGMEVVLRGPQKRYVCDVLRMGRGDSLVLFDGSGAEYPAAIVEASPRHVRLRILGKRRGERESHVDIRIGVGLLKTNKMDLVIQKVSELGVREVLPIAAQRAIPAFDPERAERRRARWRTIAEEASRQSGRSFVTAVQPILSFDQAVRKRRDVDMGLLFTAEGAGTLERLAQEQTEPPHRILLLVGPEGGFSAEEERTARENGFIPMAMGPRVLRAETAAILAVGLVQYRFGDLGGCQREDATTSR
jgi:16S rRNA (uracil1498-N3)-methyltransferase